jgi:hypothetical protein
VPFDCQHRRLWGQEACQQACPTRGSSAFEYHRVERPGEAPPRDADAADVIVLDMNHGWPNLGHAAIVHAIQNIVCDLLEALEAADLRVRVISYDVRRRGGVPPPPGLAGGLYVGTGGPGHLDPRLNDGVSPGSQGIREDPRWESGLFRLFDAICENRAAALIGVCHTFGVMCRWLDVATPVLRGEEKGGKSAGIMENVLSSEALSHPWFGRFAEALPAPHRRFRVLDNRLYDLIPHDEERLIPKGSARSCDVTPLAHETLGPNGAAGPGITMIEVARDDATVAPRILGVNHHPEIVNRARQLSVLAVRRDRGDVTQQWYEERARTLTEQLADGDRRLDLTSSYTLLGPLRFHLYRLVRALAARRHRPFEIDEDALPLLVTAAGKPLTLSALAER